MFMARQPRFIPCGYANASVSMILKFLIGPMAMLLASFAIGMHGILLRIAVIQVRTSPCHAIFLLLFVFMQRGRYDLDFLHLRIVPSIRIIM